MTFTLPDLPYPLDSLAPHISASTLETHHGKHHKAYVEKTNELVQGTRFERMQLEDVVREARGALFNQAAQAWNHAFYWRSLSPDGGGEPRGDVGKGLAKSFGAWRDFQRAFGESATGLFGSGWVWLVQNDDGSLAILETHDAGNPLTSGQKALLACDVWEHAYYLDRRNDRAAYVAAFWEVVNWDFAAQNLAAQGSARGDRPEALKHAS